MEAAARALLVERYAVRADSLEPLPTERDDSFHVRSDAGEYLLKVAHPDDDPEVPRLQTAALIHIRTRDPAIPVQRVVATTTGHLESTVDGRVARLFDWLPGELLAATVAGPDQLVSIGAEVARLHRALADFRHPAAVRTFPWDLQGLLNLRREAETYRGPGAEAVAALFTRFQHDVLPRLARLPQQVIHGDLNPGNLLVDARSPRFVVGILDFGDIVFGPRVVDLAIAAAYLLPAAGPPHAPIEALLRGYGAPGLTADETALLPDLVCARLVQRLLLMPATDERGTGLPDRDDVVHALDTFRRSE